MWTRTRTQKINTIQTNVKEFDTRTLFVSDYLEVVSPNPLVMLEKSHVVINIYLNKKYSNTTIKSPNLIFNNLKNGLAIKDKEKIINPENKMFVKIKTRLSEKQIKTHVNNQNISLAFDLSSIKTPGIYNITTNIILKENINETEIYDYETKKNKTRNNRKLGDQTMKSIGCDIIKVERFKNFLENKKN